VSISIVVCAWCRVRVRDPQSTTWRDGADPGGDDVSHGLCDRCRPGMEAQVRACHAQVMRAGPAVPLTVGSATAHDAPSNAAKRQG
jgi:hypothetical protein